MLEIGMVIEELNEEAFEELLTILNPISLPLRDAWEVSYLIGRYFSCLLFKNCTTRKTIFIPPEDCKIALAHLYLGMPVEELLNELQARHQNNIDSN